MARGQKGGAGNGRQGEGPDGFIEFTPSGAFDIRKAAKRFSRLMEDLQQPLIIHLKKVSVEFEVGCTPAEIVAGYHQALQTQLTAGSSNANPPPAPK